MTEFALDETPPEFTLKIYRGDSFGEDWSVQIPDLSVEGGPTALDESDVTVRAHIRYDVTDASPAAVFACEILNPTTRTVRPQLTRSQTARLAQDTGVWALEVLKGTDYGRTILAGPVEVSGDATR